MKINNLLLVAGIVLLASSCAESIRSSYQPQVVPPASAKSSFATQYPTAKNAVWYTYDQVPLIIDWDLTGWPAMDAKDFVVRYDVNTDHYYAWYDSNGDWIGTAYEVSDFSSLPLAVNKTLSAKYAGYAISSVHREFYKDKVAYEIGMKNADTKKLKVLIDSEGNVLKEKIKT